MHFGFLFNHYTGHQLYHSAPVAFALSQARPDLEVTIITADVEALAQVRRIGKAWPDHQCRFEVAHVPAPVRALDKVAQSWVFLKKPAVLKANRPLFRRLDVLVVPEQNSLALKDDPALGHLRLVRIRHGAGDRESGLGAENNRFDLILASGEKMRDRLLQAGVDAARIRVVGYPKFDAIREFDPAFTLREIFGNDKPVALYNPHYRRGESSWVEMGTAVLDHFRDNPDWNLIFAPHVLLYKRARRHGAKSLKAYKDAGNIYIDTFTDACIDMTYTRQADLYIGDVSSQIYEFIGWRHRPCIFLNAHGITGWQNRETCLHWRVGDVIEQAGDLPAALEKAQARFTDRYRAVQQDLVDRTFDLADGRSSADRAAEALVETFVEEAPTQKARSR